MLSTFTLRRSVVRLRTLSALPRHLSSDAAITSDTVIGGDAAEAQVVRAVSETDVEAATRTGLGFVDACKDACEALHSLTGLPWWADIVIGTVLLRSVVTLPMSIYQTR